MAGAQGDHSGLCAGSRADFGARHDGRRVIPFPAQAIQDLLVLAGVLSVAAIHVVTGTAGKEGPPGMLARQRAVRDAVAVHVQVAIEGFHFLKLLGAQDLAAVGPVPVVPGQLLAHPVVHAQVQVRKHDHRRLQPLGQVEGRCRHFKALFRGGGEEQNVTRVAVRGIGAGQDVALLRAGRHAGGRTDALHVEQDRRNLRVVAVTEELRHQRDARARGGRKGARAVPSGAQHHADRGQFVFGLYHAVIAGVVFGGAEAAAKAAKRVHQRSGRRNRVPGAERGAGINAAQGRRRVAVDDDLRARPLH